MLSKIININWDIITAVSTFLMMIATSFMAIFAGIAMYSWKKEKKFDNKIEFLSDLKALQDCFNEFMFPTKYTMIEFKDFMIKISSDNIDILKKEISDFLKRVNLLSKKLYDDKNIIRSLLNDKQRIEFDNNIDNIFKYKNTAQVLCIVLFNKQDDVIEQTMKHIKSIKAQNDISYSEIIKIVEKEVK